MPRLRQKRYVTVIDSAAGAPALPCHLRLCRRVWVPTPHILTVGGKAGAAASYSDDSTPRCTRFSQTAQTQQKSNYPQQGVV